MNIGILQSAGIAGDIIEVALNHPENTDIFNPVIYSKENQNDKNVGSDLKFGNIEGVVVAPGSSTEFKFEGSMMMYLDEKIRLATILPGETEDNLATALTADVLSERITKAFRSLQRDFCISMPRVGVVALNAEKGEVETNVMMPAISGLAEQKVYAFGPYTLNEYLEENMYQNFDITLVVSDAQATKVVETVTSEHRTRFLAGIPMIMAMTDYPATFAFDKDDLLEPALALRKAVYHVMEISRNRKAWDEAHSNPLPKLYHERREDGEKARFAIPKKKAE